MNDAWSVHPEIAGYLICAGDRDLRLDGLAARLTAVNSGIDMVIPKSQRRQVPAVAPVAERKVLADYTAQLLGFGQGG